MNIIFLIGSAFSLGLLTSLHCVGMCGPLALALPVVGKQRSSYVAGRVLYNLGRTVTYAAMGLLIGALGQAVSLGGYQRWISVSVGAVLLIGLVLIYTGWLNHLFGQFGVLHVFARLQSAWSRGFKNRSYAGFFVLGLINGLLPCGPVYVALAAAAATGNAITAVLFMFVFGLGTLPLMLAVSLAGKMVQLPMRKKLQKLVPVSAGVVAVLLIVRGLALGIPYLSPPVAATQLNGAPHSCCHQQP
jgi:uncharacterized protein